MVANNTRMVNAIRQVVEDNTGDNIDLTPGVVDTASGYFCSAYVHTDNLVEEINVPAGMHLTAGAYIVVGQSGSTAWVDRALPSSDYAQLEWDGSTGKVYAGDGTALPVNVLNIDTTALYPEQGSFDLGQDANRFDNLFLSGDGRADILYARNIEVDGLTGYGSVQLDGDLGTYIDLHGPTSVDYGARLQVFSDAGGTGTGEAALSAANFSLTLGGGSGSLKVNNITNDTGSVVSINPDTELYLLDMYVAKAAEFRPWAAYTGTIDLGRPQATWKDLWAAGTLNAAHADFSGTVDAANINLTGLIDGVNADFSGTITGVTASFSSTVTLGTDVTVVSPGSGYMRIGGNVYPDTAGSRLVGSSGNRWGGVYGHDGDFDGYLNVDEHIWVGNYVQINDATGEATLYMDRVQSGLASGSGVGRIQFRGGESTPYRVAEIIGVAEGQGPVSGDSPGQLRIATTSDGSGTPTSRWTYTASGNLIPYVDDTYDFGSSNNRVQTAYVKNVIERAPVYWGYKTTAQSVDGDSATDDISFGTALNDVLDLDEGATGASANYLRIGKRLGLWLIGFQLHIASNNTGYRQIMLSLNNTTNIAVTKVDADLGNSAILQCWGFVDATSSTDYVRFRQLNNSGVSLAINTGQGSTWRAAYYLGTET